MSKQLNIKPYLSHLDLSYVISTILIFVEIILSQIPLTKIFSYEYSAVNAIILFLFSGIITLRYYSNLDFKNSIRIIVRKISILLIISFVSGILSNIVFTNCPLSDGILFFLLLTIPSAYFGMVTAYITKYFFGRYYYSFFVISFLGIIFFPVIEFYFNPQIYFYNSVFGYFPGTIYDEDISVDFKLVSFRIFNIIVFTSLLFTTYWMLKRNYSKSKVLLGVLIIVLISTTIKPYLGFATTHSQIKKYLTSTLVTKNFKIHYSNKIDSTKIEFIGLMHEYYYEKVSLALNEKIDGKINSYIFDNETQKRNLFGAGKADVAKPWLHQICLNYPTFNETLKHEIVHIVAANFGTTPFKVAHNLNPAMIEGLAVAVVNKYDLYSVDYISKLAKTSGMDYDIESLFKGLNFFGRSSAFAYVKSGSFFRFLIKRYGVEKVKGYYRTGDPIISFKKDYHELHEEYDAFLDSVQIIPYNHTARLYFSGVPVFKKYCPRSAATETKAAWQKFNEKDYQESEKRFRKIFQYSNSYSSLVGVINSLIKMDKPTEADKLLSVEINKFSNTPYIYNLELILGDIKFRNNKSDDADSIYNNLLAQNAHIEYNNQAYIRKLLLEHELLLNFLDGEREEKLNILLNLNDDKINYHTVPDILHFSSQINVDSFVDKLKNINEVDDIYSSYALYELSKRYLLLNDYYTAQKIIINALKFRDNNYLEYILIEQLELVNWLINFSEDEISEFRYE